MEEEQIELDFPSKEEIIKHLGFLYKDPRDALVEFVTNSIDKGYGDASEVTIEIHKKEKPSYILISDNGKGMSIDDLKFIAKNIGKSRKKYKDDPRKGIAILGFITLGNRIKIISRKKESETT